MKYTTIENTPLKFHKFVWYFWMPLSFVYSVFKAISVISDNQYNLAVYQGGRAFIVFILLCLVESVFVVAPVLVFIGFFKCKKYAWLILTIESLSNAVLGPIVMLSKIGILDVHSIFGRMCGIALDVYIIYYYWKRRQLFGVVRTLKKEGVRLAEPDKSDEPAVIKKEQYCKYCGQSVPTDSSFCHSCGKEL